VFRRFISSGTVGSGAKETLEDDVWELACPDREGRVGLEDEDKERFELEP